MASFSPIQRYCLTAKTGTEALLLSGSKVWSVGSLQIVDQGGTLTAAQIFALLDNFVHSRSTPSNPRPVVELTPTTA